MPPASLAISADLLSVRAIGPWLAALFEPLPALEAAALVARLELAVHELCVNIVEHADLGADRLIRLGGTVDPARVRIEIIDSGRDFDPDEIAGPDPATPQVRGYGLMIVRKMVDQLQHRRERSRNIWTLTVNRVNPDHHSIGGAER